MNTKLTPPEMMTGCVSRISINLDDMDKYPDANYWRTGALFVEEELHKIMPKILLPYAMKGLEPYWKKENSWKEICLMSENVLDFFREFMKQRKERETK